jgi:RNA polymerase sigma-70 factor (ECF subfamily)
MVFGSTLMRISRLIAILISPFAIPGHLTRFQALSRHHAVETSSDAAEAAFDQLFKELEPKVYGYLWRMTGDESQASDICQETFLRAWQRFDQISSYEKPLAWLFRVATNLAIDAGRVNRRVMQMTEPFDEENEPAQTDPATNLAEREAILAILQQLSPRARSALVLREVYDLPLDEIAATLGATPTAIKKMLTRSREQFRSAYLREEA